MFLTLLPAQAAPQMDQTIALEPGWNAVYLEVQPEHASPAALFATLPGDLTLESAWMWDSGAPIEFIRNPGEGLQDQAGWRAFYNPPDPNDPNDPRAFLTNLYGIVGNQAYLLKLAGSSGGNWSVSGRPSLQAKEWTPNSFNLRGFAVSPSTPPSIATYFASSKAHTGQPVYRLLPSGQWQLIDTPASTSLQSGQAYYVYCKGGSDYAGPLRAELELNDGLDFGTEGNDFQVRLRNLHSTAATLSIGLVSGSGDVPLSYWKLESVADPNSSGDTITTQSWPELPTTLSQAAPSEQDVFLRFAVRRKEIVQSPAEGVLQIQDGRGTRLLLPVSAQLPTTARRSRGGALAPPAGLWVGTVELTGVNQAQDNPQDPNAPVSQTPTAVESTTSFRLLLHVDAGGQVRLLRSVILMWQDRVLGPDPNIPAQQVIVTPGRYVLLTDDTLIPGYTGVTLLDGEPIGYRLSTVAYDFDEPTSGTGQVKNTLRLTGTFDLGQAITGTLTVSPDHPTNPFLHRYHPDFDNRDAQGGGLPSGQEEAFGFSRVLRLSIASTDPQGVAGRDLYDWGVSRLEGTYQDTITGVHKNFIVVGGTFTLKLASSIDVLNP